MKEKNKNTELVDNKTDKKEELTKTQIINIDKNQVPDIDVEKEEEEGLNFEELIEKKRLDLFGKYKKNRTVNNIIMVVEVACVVAGFIMVVNNDQSVRIGGFIIMGVTLVALLMYYIFSKNKFPNETKKYIDDITLDIDRHVYNDPNFSNVKVNLKKKLEMTEILSDSVYKNATDIGSRNYVTGRFKHLEFKGFDLALYYQKDKRNRDIVFVGKYITFENKLSFDGRIIINFKGSKKLDTPTCIDDLKLKEEPGDVDVYATEGLSVSDAFTTKAFNALKRIEIKDNLVNINIVVWGGHTAIYLSYDDPVVNLPFDKAFCGSPIEQYKKNLLEIMAIMAEN